MASQCNNCASPLQPDAVVCVHCGSAVNHADPVDVEAAPRAVPTAIPPVTEPSAPPVNRTPMFVTGSDLAGIGGWLVLIMIGLAVSPFFRLHGMIVDSQLLFSSRYQARMSTRPGLEAIIFFELITNSFFLAYVILLNVLFYRKRRSFPIFMIFCLAAQFVTQLIDHLWAMHFGPAGQLTAVLQTLIAAAVWIPYMLNSIRVEQTFVN
jgi:Protein of unknown function (DUF2569)